MDEQAEPLAPMVERGRRRAPGAGRIPIWFGPVFGLLGVVAFVIGVGLVRDELRLGAEGVEARATVQHLDRTIGSGDDADTFSITYRFVTADGLTVSGRSQVDETTYRRTAVGDVVRVSYLPVEPAKNRLGEAAFQPFPALMVVGVGLLFSLVGAGLTLTAVRQRRPAGPPSAAAATKALDPALVHRFARSPMRVIVDLVLAPLGAVAFLGVAAFLLLSPGEFDRKVGGILFGLFGLLMAAGAVVTIRRGARSTILELANDSIWTPELGRRAWSEIAEIRIENASPSGSRRRNSGYRRLGIVPRDPSLAAGAPGGVARGITSAMFSFARAMRPGARVPNIDSMSPFGVGEFELEVPLEAVIPLLTPHVPVVDIDRLLIGGPAVALASDDGSMPPAAAPGPPAPRPASPGLDALLGASGTPFMAPPVASFPAVTTPAFAAPALAAPALATPALVAADLVAAAPSQPNKRARATYRRRGLAGTGAIFDALKAGLFVVLPALFAVLAVAVSIADGGVASYLFAVFPVLIAAIFVLGGLPSLFEAIGRFQVGSGDEEALVVDEDGIVMSGMDRLRWADIAEIRIGRADVVEGSRYSRPDRPRLEIVPRDLTKLEVRPWAARTRDAYIARRRRLAFWADQAPRPGAFSLSLDQLDADPDEIIDLIARYRVVVEE